MDDILKRLGIAYLWVTLGLWAISYGMTVNESVRPDNPAWGLVSSLRYCFTLGLLLAAGIVAMGVVMGALLDAIYKAREQARAKVLREQERIEAEKRKAAEQEREKAKLEAVRLKRERAEMESKRREEEREKAEIVEKQNRSARDATEEALADF